MIDEQWALVKPTIGSTEYMPVRIVRRGRRFTFVETVSGSEQRYNTRRLWDGFISYDAAVAEIDRMRAAAAAHAMRTRRNNGQGRTSKKDTQIMPYTFQITGGQSEIFRRDDPGAVPVVLVPTLDGETPASHMARTKAIAEAMSAMDSPVRENRTGSIVALVKAMHALAAECWDKAPHESDSAFAEAFVRVGDLLGIHGQDIHEDFDPRALDSVLGGEWVRNRRTIDELEVRAATIDGGLDMPSDHYEAMTKSPVGQSGDLAKAICRLQHAVKEGTQNEAHAAGCDVSHMAFALHEETERLRTGATGPDVGARLLAMLRERHERYSAGEGASNAMLALEVETSMLRLEALLRPSVG